MSFLGESTLSQRPGIIPMAPSGPLPYRQAMRKTLWVLGFVVSAFLLVRAIVEIFVIDYGDPSSYRNDWGGPSLAGVLAVHSGPGILAATLIVWAFLRARRRRIRAT